MAAKLAANRRRTNLILLLCALCLVALKLLAAPWPESAAAGRFAGLTIGAGVTGTTTRLTPEEIERRDREGMITMTINPDPVFETGTAKGNLLIENSGANSHPIVVEIVRQDTGETVYTSGLIPIGMYVDEDALAAALPAGDYDCVAYFHYVDEETGAALGSGGVAVALHVLN